LNDHENNNNKLNKEENARQEMFSFISSGTSGVDVFLFFFLRTHKRDKQKVTCNFQRCTFNVKETKKEKRQTKRTTEKKVLFMLSYSQMKNISLYVIK
jgi:hypothetical protein